MLSLKQRKMLTRKKRKRVTDIPPYIVPLSVQAVEIVRHADDFSQPEISCSSGVKASPTADTVEFCGIRGWHDGRLTGHGHPATISTALNELGYPEGWWTATVPR